MSTELFLDFLGIRMDSRKAEGMRFTINLVTPDTGEKFLIELENATLTNIKGFHADKPDLTLTIRELNDAFRRTFSGGKVTMTAGVYVLPDMVKAAALQKAATFDELTEDNDPYGDHDFGSFELYGRKFFWKIDLHHRAMEYGSEDPSDPEKTTRVMTVMLAEEY
jgi:hypothetical protein